MVGTSGGGPDSSEPGSRESDSQGAGAWAGPGAELSVAARLLLALLHGDFVDSLDGVDLRDTLFHEHLEEQFAGDGVQLLDRASDTARRMAVKLKEVSGRIA